MPLKLESAVSCLAAGIVAGLCSTQVGAVGLMPVPRITDASLAVTVEATGGDAPFDTEYTYTYSVTNVAGNEGGIWYLKVDISAPDVAYDFPADPTFPAAQGRADSADYRARLRPYAAGPEASLVPIGQNAPPGWNGGFGKDGYAGFAVSGATPRIMPGETLGGFQILSHRVPTLRDAILLPEWFLEVEDHDAVDAATAREAFGIERALPVSVTTLGPSPVPGEGSFEHWDQVAVDLGRMETLGWVRADVAAALRGQLAEARAALDTGDGSRAKERLQRFAERLASLAQADLTDDARLLLRLNLIALMQATPDTPVAFEPAYRVTPADTSLPVGATYQLNVVVLNRADHDAPVSGFEVNVVPRDEERAEAARIVTDAAGIAVYSHTGTATGVDRFDIYDGSGEVRIGTARVAWDGGVDLAVPVFIPPIIETESGNRIYLSDTTLNVGSLGSPDTLTRYFIADQEPVDPATAVSAGERLVPALPPGAGSTGTEVPYVVPPGLDPGEYFMVACADADNAVVETDETNNCSSSRLSTTVALSVPLKSAVPPNTPPDCDGARAEPDAFWPPNHDLIDPVNIVGVEDADGDAIAIRIDRIEQDEPVDHLGDGRFVPDGFGVGTGLAQVRRERSGTQDGRVYEIQFTASDGHQASCSGSVRVGVPHDQGRAPAPMDSGVRYDSTVVCGPDCVAP